MRNIRLLLQYDGTRYFGWQRQGEEQRTIQGRLEAVLSRMSGEALQIIGAGRTDAGAHALGQVANFHTASPLPVQGIRDYCNRHLPEDIVVLAAEEADPRFHARYRARAKRYHYRICNRLVRDVFSRRYAWHVPEPLDLGAMRRAAALLVGEHDFRSFTSLKSKHKSAVRRLTALEAESQEGEATLRFEADGFLYNMARILTGTLVEVGLGRLAPERVGEILAARDRSLAGPMAPPHGLFLVEVLYDEAPRRTAREAVAPGVAARPPAATRAGSRGPGSRRRE
jgi:tRNA pseudouridine38-40 synthase